LEEGVDYKRTRPQIKQTHLLLLLLQKLPPPRRMSSELKYSHLFICITKQHETRLTITHQQNNIATAKILNKVKYLFIIKTLNKIANKNIIPDKCNGIKNDVFCDVTPCDSCNSQHFGGN
jgi:hypothetical protein